MSTPSFATLDISSLALVSGGQAAPPQGAPGERTWSQVAREYGAACVMGAGQSLVHGGRPSSVRDVAINAAVGCATGVAKKAAEDLGRTLTRNLS